MIRHYAMCPACGRSILVEPAPKPRKDGRRGLRAFFDGRLIVNALEHGGEVWKQITTSKGRGTLAHETGDASEDILRRVVKELRRRCKTFLERTE